MPKKVQLYQVSDAMQLVLQNGGEVSFVTSGFSMLPLLRNKTDTATLVTLRKPDRPIQRGDVIFYRRPDGGFVLHRVIGKRKDGFVLRGDNQRDVEYGVQPEWILAMLVRVRRKEGKVIDCRSFGYKIYQSGLPLVRLFRLHIYPQYVRFLAPLMRKILKK